MSLMNTGEFISLFLIFESVISFSCFITVPRASRTMLDRRTGEHLQVGFMLKRKEFSISTVNVMIAEDFG